MSYLVSKVTEVQDEKDLLIGVSTANCYCNGDIISSIGIQVNDTFMQAEGYQLDTDLYDTYNQFLEISDENRDVIHSISYDDLMRKDIFYVTLKDSTCYMLQKVKSSCSKR